MMMMNNYDKYKISTLQNTIKKNRGAMASSSNKGSSMAVQTLMTNRQMASGESTSNNILDLRKQKLQMKNKLNLAQAQMAQVPKGGEPSRESNDKMNILEN